MELELNLLHLNLYLICTYLSCEKYLLKSSDDVKIGKRISMFIQNAKLHSLTISCIRMYHIFVSHCVSYVCIKFYICVNSPKYV